MPKDAVIPWLSIGPLIGVFGIWFVGMGLYAIRTARKGQYQERRVEEMGGTRLANTWVLSFGYWMIHGIGDAFVKMRISPNMLTFLSLITAAISGVFLFFGWFGLGGWLMIASALFDVFDGMVARRLGVSSEAGEYFDSVVDRYCELFTFIALMGYYFQQQPVIALVVGLAMVASIMITFNRAKGEAQGVTGVPSGLMRRHERLLYIGVGTAASPILALWLEPGAARPVFHLSVAAVGLVALLGNYTAIKLGVEIHKRIKGQVVEESTEEISEDSIHLDPIDGEQA